jgi:hypothetical protein
MNEETLFIAALEKLTERERRAFLDAACGYDTALRERIEQLLSAHSTARGILDQSALAGDGRARESQARRGKRAEGAEPPAE